MATKSSNSSPKRGTSRPKPLSFKAGFTATKRRYGCGGKIKHK